MRKTVFIISAIVLLSGCAHRVSQSNLYWGNYSQTLYQVKKEPGEASSQAHEKELQSIVEESEQRNLKVPPGIYAELGVYAKERGDKNSARSYFGLEQEAYPEGATLMKRTLSERTL